jgi:hypothetical protein
LLGFSGDVAAYTWSLEKVPVGQPLLTPTPLFAKYDPPIMPEGGV